MFSRLQTFLYTSTLILAIAMILTWQTHKNIRYFIDTQQLFEKTVVDNAAAEIGDFIHDLQTAAHIFADEYAPSFQYMQANPNNVKYRNDMIKRMRRRFPDYMSFSVTNELGKLLYQDRAIHFGQICEKEVRQYAIRNQNVNKPAEYWQNIRIHPKPQHYHFDTMSPWPMANRLNRGIFLLGLKPNALIKILKRQQIPGYRILLVHNNGNGNIEVTAEGTTDKLLGDVYLSKDELMRVYAKTEVKGTAWQLVSIPDENLFSDYEKKLWLEAFLILAIVAVVSLLMSDIIWRVTQRKNTNND